MFKTILYGVVFWSAAMAGFFLYYRPDQGIVKGASIITPVFAAEPETLLPPETYYGNPVLDDVAAMISERQIVLNPEDQFRYFPEPALGLGSTIRVYRATPIKLVDGGAAAKTYRSFQKTVKALLDEQKIELGDKDKINPTLESELKPDLLIEIIRVTVTEVTTNEPIDFKTITKEDPNLDRGKRNITQQGKKGNRKKVFEVTRENGKEVARKKIKEEVTSQPVDEIVVIGTKEVILGDGTATWYGGVGALTAAHNSLPFGTKVRVTAVRSGKSVVVTIKDRGIRSAAIIDLSRDAFAQLAPLGAGVIAVKLTQE